LSIGRRAALTRAGISRDGRVIISGENHKKFVALLTAALLSVSAASAASLDLLSAPDVASTFTLTDDGITGTFTTVLSGNSGSTTPGGLFLNSGSGVGFGNGEVLEFTLSFDADVQVTAVLGTVFDSDTFDITGPGVSSLGNTGSQPLVGGPLSFAAGVDYLFSTAPAVNGQGTTLTAIEFTAAEVVPLPASVLFLLAGIGGFLGLRRLRPAA
jgi:hypothetical protein